MSHLDPLTAESGVVVLGWLVSVVLSLVFPWCWSLELSLIAVAFVEAAFAQVVFPLESVLQCLLRWLPERTGCLRTGFILPLVFCVGFQSACSVC